MKQNYIVILLLLISQLGFSTTNATVLPPSATISGGTTVCQNATSPVITFTGSGGTAPYTFTYTVNGGPNQTIQTTGTNSTVTLSVSTTTTGTFTYNLIRVQDSQPPSNPVNVSDSEIVIINSPPNVDFTFNNNKYQT
jgi:hypothetical protein